MPEATASYVVLGGRSYRALSDNAPGVSWLSSRGSASAEREDVPARSLPPPEYMGLREVAVWVPAQVGAVSNALPNLAARPVTAVLKDLPSATNGVTVSLSPGLQRSDFHFSVPPGIATNTPAEARFHVEIDAQGNVIYLLAEPSDNPAVQRLLETAIDGGHGIGAGRGQVLVSWGK